MKTILLFGAGKSATVLIDYLLKTSIIEDWYIVVVDADLKLAESKIGSSTTATAVSFDISNTFERVSYIENADIVISMLPPFLHIEIAKDCILFKKNLLTASYVDDSIKEFKPEIENNKILFLYEMGLDPGIDHMSAMKIINDIHEKGGKVSSFKSHCGGLVAPESDDNPWHYKISWNPRNIIMAGKSGGHFIENGTDVKLKYMELFNQEKQVEIPEIGKLSWYPNRDSLSYISLYGLQDTPTFIRTTLRHPDFMYGWKKIIDLNLIDETLQYASDGKSLQEVFKEHMDKNGFGEWFTEQLTKQSEGTNGVLESLFLKQLFFLGFNDASTLVNKGLCSAADVLQFAVEKKLALQPTDKDMIVMLHEIEYELEERQHSIKSSLVVKGENNLKTAMAKTVGLPLGIAAKLILNGKIKLTGLQIPTSKEIYEPVLKELEAYEIKFLEITKAIN